MNRIRQRTLGKRTLILNSEVSSRININIPNDLTEGTYFGFVGKPHLFLFDGASVINCFSNEMIDIDKNAQYEIYVVNLKDISLVDVVRKKKTKLSYFFHQHALYNLNKEEIVKSIKSKQSLTKTEKEALLNQLDKEVASYLNSTLKRKKK